MNDVIAGEERKSRMPQILHAVKQDIVFYFRKTRLKFVPRLSFPASRLQTPGASGGDIVKFQERFNLFASPYGIETIVNGVYDGDTIGCVQEFQRSVMYVMDADGFIGPETARVLSIKLLEGR